MKKLIILLLVVLMSVGCGRKEPQSFPEIDFPEATVVPTAIIISPAKSVEEEIAQEMERTSNYKTDVYDIRLFNDNPYSLPLKADSGYPTVVFILNIISLENEMTPLEQQLTWEATKRGILRLAGSDRITGFHYFFTANGILQSGLWCAVEMLEVMNINDGRCDTWPGVAPLPPEMTRFIGF